jgi:phytoene desaturase
MTSQKNIGVIGAGPGGLAAACLLQSRGFSVTLFESREKVGGRNSQISLGDFRFDTGPTFFLMPQVLAEIFQKSGKALEDYLKLKRLDPLYTLDFGDGMTLQPRVSAKETAQEIAKLSPSDADAYILFRERQKNKFESILPTLKGNADSVTSLMKIESLKALPFLDLKSVYGELAQYFQDERVRLMFTFQAKYLGMSPFECPSLFTILPHIEHDLGVWHPVGGCSAVSEALAKLFQDLGGNLRLNASVEKVVSQKGKINGLKLESGEFHSFDQYVMGADFAYGMRHLFQDSERKKYNNKKLETLKLSCSTFMMYLGLNKKLDWPHHRIFFSTNYRKNLREIFDTFEVPQDPSFYVHNPSLLDETLAPEGCSSVYILVPVPRLRELGETNWDSLKIQYRNHILDVIQERTGEDLRSLIVEEKIVTPLDWQEDYRVYKGATFSLSHTPDQLLFNRPHNQSEDFSNLYLVGGGTHPGSGLPTIFESGRIAADLITQNSEKISLETIEKTVQMGVEKAKHLGFAALPYVLKAKEAVEKNLNLRKLYSNKDSDSEV